jgi:hypothetical protein
VQLNWYSNSGCRQGDQNEDRHPKSTRFIVQENHCWIMSVQAALSFAKSTFAYQAEIGVVVGHRKGAFRSNGGRVILKYIVQLNWPGKTPAEWHGRCTSRLASMTCLIFGNTITRWWHVQTRL